MQSIKPFTRDSITSLTVTYGQKNRQDGRTDILLANVALPKAKRYRPFWRFQFHISMAALDTRNFRTFLRDFCNSLQHQILRMHHRGSINVCKIPGRSVNRAKWKAILDFMTPVKLGKERAKCMSRYFVFSLPSTKRLVYFRREDVLRPGWLEIR